MSSGDHSLIRPGERGVVFWMVIMTLVVSIFMVTLEGTIVATALPTITSDLHAKEFVWVLVAYNVASAALLPLSGGLAQVFGRRPVMISSLFLFLLGSALCGASQDMSMLVASRVVLGMGGGGIISMSTIVIADIVPLHERGTYNGVLALTWSVAGGIGPVIGGALTQIGQWRWIFYLNIPIGGVAVALVIAFLKLPTPPGTILEKFFKIDWMGNFIICASTTSLVLGLTWGGVQYPWSSPQVLVPICVGCAGLVLFVIFEILWCRSDPLVPFRLIANKTTISGYLQTFTLSIPFFALLYYLPVYYQACQSASPTASGIDIFGVSFTIAPLAIIAGVSITVTKHFRPQIWMGWCVLVVGMGLLSTLGADTPRKASIGYQAVAGVGIGLIYSSTHFPVLAPLPISANAHAIALFVFLRTFSQIWGVAIGSIVLQNGLQRDLPAQFTALFPPHSEIAYATIPEIATLPQPLRDEVRNAFASSLATLWQVMIVISSVGLLLSLLMKPYSLHAEVDKDWQVQDGQDSSQAIIKEGEVPDSQVKLESV